MNLCTGYNKHEEICFEEKHCPLCEAMNKIAELEELIGDLEEEKRHECQINTK